MLKLNELKIELSSGGSAVIESASLEMAPGEILILKSANGSGKSTLLSAIMSHPSYHIISGSIMLNDMNITDYSTSQKAALGIYLAPQFVPAIEGVSLIQLLHKASNADISILDFNKYMIAYSDRFGINKDFLSRDLNLGMSGGEKKQSMLLSLLALKPLYILLDEPDSGLDADGISKLIEVIKYLNNNYNIAFLIITHSQELSSKLNISRSYKIENKCLAIE